MDLYFNGMVNTQKPINPTASNFVLKCKKPIISNHQIKEHFSTMQVLSFMHFNLKNFVCHRASNFALKYVFLTFCSGHLIVECSYII